jgi:hypothetical protein
MRIMAKSILAKSNRICQVDGCNNKHDSHGYCGKHNMRIKRGQPLISWEELNPGLRRCLKCGKGFPPTSEHFAKHSAVKSGLGSTCIICYNIASSEYRKNNIEAVKKTARDHYKRNAIKYSIQNKQRLQELKTDAKGYRDFRDKKNVSAKKWRTENSSRYNEIRKQRRDANPEKYLKQARDNMKKHRKNPRNRIAWNTRGLITRALKGRKNGQHWETLVGWTLDDLMKHLEKQFKPGMTWENYGRRGWNIDHIIPIAVFNFESYNDIDFYKCWSLKNLQPLWEKENQIKNAKLEKPFQPSLAFGGAL